MNVEAGRADLAAGGAEGPAKATQEGPALAERRLVHPSAARASEPRLVLRLRRGPDPRRKEVPHAQHHRRVHPGMPGDPGRPEARVDRRHRRAVGPVHPARRARPHPVRQRPGVHRQGGAGLDRRRRRQDRLHRARAAHGRTATARASTPSSATSCSTARSSTASPRRRSSSRAGAATTTPSARTHHWATARQLPRSSSGRLRHPEPLRRPPRP